MGVFRLNNNSCGSRIPPIFSEESAHMTKNIPCQNPEFCWAITVASYEHDPKKRAGFLEKHAKDAQVIAEESVRGWKMILVKSGDQYSVAFRGTDNWHNWLGNIWHELVGPGIHTTKKMEQILDRWETEFKGKITLFTAHSGAAEFARAVRKAEQIARVLFNAHKADRDPNHLYLSTQDDILTHYFLAQSGDPAANIDMYNILGQGTHGIRDFEHLVSSKQWPELLQNSSSFTLNWHAKEACRALYDQIESGEIVMHGKDLDVIRDYTDSVRDVLEKANNMRELLQSLRQGTTHLANQMYTLMQQDHAAENEFWHLRHRRMELEEAGGRLGAQFDQSFGSSSFAQFSAAIHQQHHPLHGLAIVAQIRELTNDHKQQLDAIFFGLGSAERSIETIRAQFQNLEQLDSRQQKAYRKLLKTQERLGQRLRMLERICSGIEFVASTLKHATPAYAIVAQTATTALQFIAEKYRHDGEKQIRRASANLERNLHTRERLASGMERALSDQRIYVQGALSTLDELLCNPSRFIPVEHRLCLTQTATEISKQIALCTTSMHESQQRVQSLDSQISSKKTSLNHVIQTKGGKHGEKKRELEQRAEKLRSEIADLEQQRLDLANRYKDEEAAKGQLEKDLERAGAALARANSCANLRDHVWSVIQRNSDSYCANNEVAQFVRNEVNEAFRLYYESQADGRLITQNLFSNIYYIALGLGYRGSAIQAAAAGYEIYNQIRTFIDIGSPCARFIMDQYNGDFFRAFREQPLVFGMHFLLPATALLLAGIQIVQGIRQMFFSSSKSPSIEQALLEEIQRELFQIKQSIEKTVQSESLKLSNQMSDGFDLVTEMLSYSNELLLDRFDALEERMNSGFAESATGDFTHRVKLEKHSIYQFTELANKRLSNLIDKQRKSQFINNFRKYLNDLFIQIRQSLIKSSVDEVSVYRLDHFYAYLNTLPPLRREEFLFDWGPFTTSLIPQEFDMKDSAPSWGILNLQMKEFLTLADRMIHHPKLIRAIEETPELKKGLVSICGLFLSQIEKIGAYRHQISMLVRQLHLLKNSFISSQAVELRDIESRHERALIDSTKAAVNGFNWDHFTENLVAEKRFALREEFGSKFPERISQLGSLLQERYIAIHGRALHTFWFKKLYSFGIWGFDQGNNTINKKEAKKQFDKTWAQLKAPERLVISTTDSKGINSSIATKVEKPNDVSKEAFEQDLLDQGMRVYQLVIRLKERQLIWQTPSAENPKAIQLLSIKISSNMTQFTDHVVDPLFSEKTLEAIGATNEVNGEDYRDFLSKLIIKYKNSLEKIVNDELNHAETIDFYSNKNRGRIILSANQGSIPLVLPAVLLNHLQTLLPAQLIRDIYDLELGTVQPRYEFSARKGELTLSYELLVNDQRLLFAKFVIAQFDPLTVRTFHPDWSSISEEFDPSELLIQALYGQFAKTALGLPDEKSFRLENTAAVVPNESAVRGLYMQWIENILPKRPEGQTSTQIAAQGNQPAAASSVEMVRAAPAVIVRQEGSSAASSAPAASEQQLKPLPKNKACVEHLTLIPGNDLMKVQRMIAEKKRSFSKTSEIEKSYRNQYHLLELMISLFSRIDREEVQSRLEKNLQIIHPDRLRSLLETNLDPSFSESDLVSLIELLQELPSRHLINLQSVQRQLQELQGRMDFASVSGSSAAQNVYEEDEKMG